MTVSQSEGSAEMQGGACHTLPSSSSQKGKQKKRTHQRQTAVST